MDKAATMTAMPDEIITTVVEKETVIKRQKGLTPDALLFAMKDCKNSRGGTVGKGPKRDKRDDKRDNQQDRKEKNPQKCFHCQWQGHITDNSLGKQCNDPPQAADGAATASTETTSTLTTSIESYWMVASRIASSSNWCISCGYMTRMSGRRSMFITYTEYSLNTKQVKGYNGVTLFASGDGSDWLIYQLLN